MASLRGTRDIRSTGWFPGHLCGWEHYKRQTKSASFCDTCPRKSGQSVGRITVPWEGRRAHPGEVWRDGGWGLLATIPHLSLATEVAIRVMTVLLRGAGEKLFLGLCPHQLNLSCTFQVGCVARSSEMSVVFWTPYPLPLPNSLLTQTTFTT